MENKIIQLIEKLEKATPELWNHLVWGEFVRSWIQLGLGSLFALILIAIGVMLGLSLRKSLKEHKIALKAKDDLDLDMGLDLDMDMVMDQAKKKTRFWMSECLTGLALVCFFFGLALVVCAFGLMGILAPEYYAIHNVLR